MPVQKIGSQLRCSTWLGALSSDERTPHRVMQRPGTPCRRAMTASGSIRVILPLFLAAVSVPACDAWMGPAPAGGLALSRVRGVCAMKTVMHSVVSLRASSAVSHRSSSFLHAP